MKDSLTKWQEGIPEIKRIMVYQSLYGDIARAATKNPISRGIGKSLSEWSGDIGCMDCFGSLGLFCRIL